MYLNPAFLSNLAVFVKDQVPRGMRRKGAVEYEGCFTGEEVVVSSSLGLLFFESGSKADEDLR